MPYIDPRPTIRKITREEAKLLEPKLEKALKQEQKLTEQKAKRVRKHRNKEKTPSNVSHLETNDGKRFY